MLTVSLAGCIYYTPAKQPQDYFYLNQNKNISNIGKVALLELENQTNQPRISQKITNAMFQALQKKQAFSLKTITRQSSNFQSLQLNKDDYSLKKLLAIKDKLNCNAVLFGSVTEYTPYPHMTVGLKLKLLDLNDGQLIWACEQIWDAADKSTEKRIEKYFCENIRSDLTPLHEELMAVSPIEFIKFVTYEVAQTLKN